MRRPQVAVLDRRQRYPAGLSAVLCRDFGVGVVAPATAGRTTGGFLILSRASDACPLGLGDLNVLRVTGQTLGLVLRNRDLSSESRQSAAVLETAYAVSRAISRSLDLDKTLREVALNAARIMEGSHCLLLELDEESGELVTVASSEAEANALSGLRICFDDGLPVSEELKKGRSLVVDDLVWGARVSPELRARLDMQSALFLPMRAHGKLVGALLLYSSGVRHSFPDHEVARAEDIAEQAAIAIQNAVLYRDLASSQARVEALVARIARIREQERQTFAGLVHDDVVQSIVGAVYELQAIGAGLPRSSVGELDRVVEILRQSIKDARRIIWELRPPVLDELGLKESLRALAERLNQDGPARVRVSLEQTPDPGRGVSTAVYKIAREALLNACRHAEADTVELRLWLEDQADGRRLRLDVRDDGCGFDHAALAVDDHYGLAMMEEQAALVGGAVRAESSPGVGTVVRVSIALEEREA
jgi:signal transduction histidine kinase